MACRRALLADDAIHITAINSGPVSNRFRIRPASARSDEQFLLPPLFFELRVCIDWPRYFRPPTLTYPNVVEASYGAAVLFWLLTATSIVLLLAVGLIDPGILPYYAEPPPGAEAWPFSQQAKTYRPPDALYTRDCNVIIDGFDHVCPWTGTAIGRQNVSIFYVFLISLFVLVCYDVAL